MSSGLGNSGKLRGDRESRKMRSVHHPTFRHLGSERGTACVSEQSRSLGQSSRTGKKAFSVERQDVFLSAQCPEGGGLPRIF